MRTFDGVQPVPFSVVPFTVTENPPTVVRVLLADGRTFELTMRLAIHSLVQIHQPNPVIPENPVLNFQASVVTSMRRL